MTAIFDLPRIGMGCWAIGGHFHAGGTPLGWAGADDATSRATIEAAWDAGIRLYDTAVAYGAGHSERLLGEVLSDRDAFIVTKFAPLIDEAGKEILGEDITAEAIRASALASRERLRRDTIDLLLCHKNSMSVDEAPAVFDTLDALVSEGVIAAYGWSTDFWDRLHVAQGRAHFAAIEHAMNIFFDAPSMCREAEAFDVAQLIRGPLAMGLLTGKFRSGDKISGADIRSNTMDWMDYFKDGQPSDALLAQIAAVRECLTTGGRSLTQGALCWLLAKSDRVIPIPGAKTPEQVRENAKAMEFGPLDSAVMAEIEAILTRPAEGPPRER